MAALVHVEFQLASLIESPQANPIAKVALGFPPILYFLAATPGPESVPGTLTWLDNLVIAACTGHVEVQGDHVAPDRFILFRKSVVDFRQPATITQKLVLIF